MSRTRVFVSYSHADRDWLVRFSMHVAVLERKGLIDVWSDDKIGVGARWEAEIESALSAAKIAVLMVSPAFLASEFIWKNEMPRIVAHAAQGMDALPLLVRPCAWKLEEVLADLQARPTDGKPLSLVSEGEIDQKLSAFAYELAARIGESPVAAAGFSTQRPDESSIVRSNDEWTGYYNNTRPIRLIISDVSDKTFRGQVEYTSEGTVTTVEGSIHDRWSANDPLWSQIGGAIAPKHRLALSFRETGYETKGSSLISFDGEYRAFIDGSEFAGAWFNGTRLVGSVMMKRSPRA